MRSSLVSRYVLLAITIVPLPAFAQNVPVRTLSKPDVEYSEPFTAIAGVRELKDGRLVVVDQRDKTVQLVDLAAGKAEKIGREGSGPGEYSFPQRVFPLGGDTSAVLDGLNRRMLQILPNGRPGAFIDVAPPSTGGGGRGGMLMGFATVAGVDNRGRFYSQGSPFAIVDGTPQTLDSVAIERLDRATNKRDTVGFLPQPKGANQVSGGRGGGMQVRIGGTNPFAAADQWAVSPDGRVAVVYAGDYHIVWTDANGKKTSTPPIKFDRIKVSEAHKDEWRESRKGQMGMQVTNQNGKMSAQMVPMTGGPEPTDWPEYMPPFLSSGTSSVSFSNDGLLWVRRTGPAGQAPTFDLIDRSGKVAQKVVLPKKSRLVGFGNGTVYVVRVDDDDLQYLQRYKFTPADRP